MKTALAQIRVKTGDIEGNEKRILAAIKKAPLGTQMLVFPEMCVSGYNCGQLFEYEDFIVACHNAVLRIAAAVPEGMLVFIGAPRFASEKRDDSGNIRLHNSAYALRDGKVLEVYDKHVLANDHHHEDRKYFVPGRGRLVLDHCGEKVAVFVCEDIWHEDWVDHVLDKGQVHHVVVLNFSYFCYDKLPVRHALCRRIAEKYGSSVYYCNAFGVGDIGKNILTYDGFSFAVLRAGDNFRTVQMPGYCEAVEVAEQMSPLGDVTMSKWEQIYNSSIHSTRWMYEESGLLYDTVHVSGGLDSAVVAALGTHALGSDKTIFITNPGEHTSETTLGLARRIAAAHQVPLVTAGVAELEQGLYAGLKGLPKAVNSVRSAESFGIVKATAAAVGRTVFGLSITNYLSAIGKPAGILATGNHTENVLGWCNFHDIGSVGVMQPIGDLTKLEVVQLGAWLNQRYNAELVPWEIINGAMPDRVLEAVIGHERGDPAQRVVPMAELGDAREDPFDYYVYSGVCAYLIRDRETPESLMERFDSRSLSVDYFPAELIYSYSRSVFEAACYDAESRSRRSVYKTAQHAPALIQSRRSRGFSSRETLINHFARKRPAPAPEPRSAPVVAG